MPDRPTTLWPSSSMSGEGPPNPPLSVWPTGQRDLATQLRDSDCVRGTSSDTDLIPPAIAAHAIATYSLPGDLVLDPDCGVGIVLVKALQAGRHALGLTANSRWWTLTRANITAAKAAGAWHDGSVLDARPTLLATVHAAGLVGRIGLVVTALRPSTGDPGARAAGPDHDPTAAIDELAATLTYCEPLLRSGGHLVVVTRPRRNTDGSLVDLTTPLIAAGISAGLAPVDRCIALSAGLRGNRLVPRASLADRRAVARARAISGTPVALTVHHEVLVFRLAHDAELAAATADSPWPTERETASRSAVNGVDYSSWRRAA